MEPEVIVEEWSPVGEMQAFVEKSDRTYFFYIWMNPQSEHPVIKACWVCNRVKAPKGMEDAFATEGGEPCMPAEYVAHDLGGIELDESSLSIQWFEEGDAAALLSDGKPIAVIPGFSGYNNFHGYSIYAKGMGPFAWSLEQAKERFEAVVARSREFWAYFDEDDYWGKVQESQMKSLEVFFGLHEKYYVIDNGKFPPKALVQGRANGLLYGITLGVSMIPMPRVEMNYEDDYRDYRRMELGFACDERYEPQLRDVFSAMSFLSSFPWLEQTFLGHGHTIPFDGIPGYKYFLFLNAADLPGVPAPAYGKFMDDRVNLLWLKPITEKEYKLIVNKGVDAYLAGKKTADVYCLR